MTFRHRHCRRGRLIETAEVEQRKVEAGARKQETCGEEERESDATAAHSVDCFGLPASLPGMKTTFFPHLPLHSVGQAPEKAGG